MTRKTIKRRSLSRNVSRFRFRLISQAERDAAKAPVRLLMQAWEAATGYAFPPVPVVDRLAGLLADRQATPENIAGLVSAYLEAKQGGRPVATT